MPKQATASPLIEPDEVSTSGVNTTGLARYLDRVERVEEEIAAQRDDIKEIFLEAKSRGFDVKLMRKAHAIRKMKSKDRAVLGVYVDALSLFED
jgi:uncharacterized protein (UPF0335 family)